MKDDELLFDYNVQERVNDFVEAAMAQVCNCISVIANQLRCTGTLFLILLVKETVVSSCTLFLISTFLSHAAIYIEG